MALSLRSILIAALLGLFALAATGCGETTIDPVKLEGATQKSLEDSLHEKIVNVECPSGEQVTPGQTFSCAVDFPKGERATATLQIRNQEADVDLVGLKSIK